MTALGAAFQVLSALMLLTLSSAAGQFYVSATSFVMGLGLGFSSTALIVIVQSAVDWSRRGIVTAGVQFMRTLGSTFGVAMTGTVLNYLLLINATPGQEASSISTVSRLLDPMQRHLVPPNSCFP